MRENDETPEWVAEQLRKQWAKHPPAPNPDAKPDDIDQLRRRLAEAAAEEENPSG
jgi:hypothetical protein